MFYQYFSLHDGVEHYAICRGGQQIQFLTFFLKIWGCYLLSWLYLDLSLKNTSTKILALVQWFLNF